VKLPNGERAVVDIRKLTEYALNPDHASGADKAAGFSKALGMTPSDAAALRLLLLEAAGTAEARPFNTIPEGELLTVDAMIDWNDRRAVVRTGWIIRNGEDFPRLTTAFVMGPDRRRV
jgi:hypothetical protein